MQKILESTPKQRAEAHAAAEADYTAELISAAFAGLSGDEAAERCLARLRARLEARGEGWLFDKMDELLRNLTPEQWEALEEGRAHGALIVGDEAPGELPS